MFIKWIQGNRSNAFYPVPKKLSEELCKHNMDRYFQPPLLPFDQAACDSPTVLTMSAEQSTTPLPKTPMFRAKRNREMQTGTVSVPRVPHKRQNVHCTKTKLFPTEDSYIDDSDCASADSWSASDDGKFTSQWTEEAVEKWRTRPEPHRSEAIHDVAHKLKVRDGRNKQYATLFEWAAFQRQSHHADTIKKMIARCCIQDKVGRRKYEKDLIPYYTVCSVHKFVAWVRVVFVHKNVHPTTGNFAVVRMERPTG